METRSNWTKRWVDQSGEQWRTWNLKTDRRNEFVRKMKHFCPSLTPWKIIINWTRRNEAYWQAIDSCTRKIRKFSTNRRCLFRRIFDWNYLKLRSRLYRNLDCLFRFTSNWRWRKRFFFQLGSTGFEGWSEEWLFYCGSQGGSTSASGKRVGRLSIDDKVLSAISKFGRSKDRF